MRILMISHLYPSTQDPVYGNFVHSQVKALLDLGNDIRVVAPSPMAPFPLYLVKEKWRRFRNVPKQDIYQGVEVSYPRIIRTPQAIGFELSGHNYYHVLKSIVRKEHKANPFQLIHAQVGYPDGWAAAKLAQELNLPLVITLHGQELQKIVRWSPKLRSLVLNTLKKADAVVTVSPKMIDLAQEHGVPKDKLHLNQNGLDPLPPAELPKELKAKLAGKTILLSVSRLEPEKGLQHNLEALNILRQTHPHLVYLVVGSGPYRANLEQQGRDLNLQDRLILAGQQPRDQVQAYYTSSHIFSMPSRDESFGLVYLEAMAAGLPVIGTEKEGIAPLVQEHNVGRLVPHGDTKALAEAITQLLEPGTREAMEGKELAATFTWQKNAANMQEIYKSLLSS